jgi:hypothetical protein
MELFWRGVSTFVAANHFFWALPMQLRSLLVEATTSLSSAADRLS